MDLNNLVYGGRRRQQTAPAETDEEMARRLQAEWAAPPARRRQQTNAYTPDAPSASRRPLFGHSAQAAARAASPECCFKAPNPGPDAS